jgi:radical SAM family RiPP maturation amino acid epimerase
MAECRELYLRAGDCSEANARFHAWRQRQIRRAASELGAMAIEVTHPILAFELSAGCSIGCWFCGISAERFQGNFLYTDENADLWRSILGHSVELFGMAAQTGFCYWATDPSDNPDYPKFIEDYFFITGSLPQTTTAAPLRNVEFTRNVLQLADRYRCLTNRFSILSLRIFDAVHQTFSAEELMGVELVLQNRESLAAKALAGRARDRHEKLLSAGKAGSMGTIEASQPTIACVSGFLVNMVNRTIQLVTPTRSGERWPLGYRIHGERRFATARDFRLAIESLIDAHMPKCVASSDVVSFRDDLAYAPNSDGFELNTAHGGFALGGFPGAALLGDLIHQGNQTGGEIQRTLTSAGADFLVTASALQQLFDHGLLNEDPKLGGIGSGVRPMGMLPILTTA